MFEFAFLTSAFLFHRFLLFGQNMLWWSCLQTSPLSLAVSVCGYACVLPLRNRMFPCTYNSDKIACTDSMISSRIEGSPTFLLLILDLHFQGQFSLFNNQRNIVNGEKYSKHYYCHSMGSRVFASEWLHCEFLYIMTLDYIFKITNFGMWISRKR